MLVPKTKYRWLQCFVVGVVLLLLPILIINLLIDPLWMLSGNRLEGKNFAWNERQAKVNRLANGQVSMDCVVLGTSRSTLLSEHLINGGKTFNFAVSGASIPEYVQLAQHVKEQGYRPGKVIVEVSRGQLIGKPNTNDVNLQPSPLIPTSLSKGTFRFSLLTLLDSPPLPRFYDAEFQCGVLPNQSPYVPDRESGKQTPISLKVDEPLATLCQLREVFPEAEFTAYLPPQCAFDQKRLFLRDPVRYAEIPQSLVDVFGRVVDVSLPSSTTLDPANTYDGSHYYREVMDRVAKTLDGHPDPDLDAVIVTDDPDYSETIASRMESVQFVLASVSGS
ncbi:hypothetical protein [Rhodopirellula europaea]|uniref:Uncharacterized protein n=1 Tax=Rhodopirellula europaea SH398 TaxID=1263868 RepID=M5RZH1_9BACT|nr:hypothetical protein [Rhodopirellula europaea]EMI24758.1 hypothetical protein RESH_04630 [Rhodopirellula europaea SH398]